MLNKLASIVFFFTQRTINSVGKVAEGGECAPRKAHGAAARSEAADTEDGCRPRPDVRDRPAWGSRVECKGSLPMLNKNRRKQQVASTSVSYRRRCLANEVGG